MNVTHIVTYSCRHTAFFSEEVCPKIGEMVPCIRCREQVMVINAPAEYRIRCRKCKFSKAYGTSKTEAQLGSVRHKKGRPDHVVDLVNGKVIVQTFQDYTQTQIVA